jgi:uncharacterized protein (DUF433 family)
MTVVSTSHIALDDQGKALVAQTRTKVTLIVRDILGGMTPEQVCAAYPYLSLAQVHAALSYYYDNKASLDAEMGRQDRLVEQVRAQTKQPSRAELEQRLRERGKQA